jgi:hypothetical protein
VLANETITKRASTSPGPVFGRAVLLLVDELEEVDEELLLGAPEELLLLGAEEPEAAAEDELEPDGLELVELFDGVLEELGDSCWLAGWLVLVAVEVLWVALR